MSWSQPALRWTRLMRSGAATRCDSQRRVAATDRWPTCLALGADPLALDDDGSTALDLCRANRASYRVQEPFDRVEALLSPDSPA